MTAAVDGPSGPDLEGEAEADARRLATRSSLRAGLVSDTHIPEARSRLWPEVFEAFRDVDCILHAGDIHDVAILDELSAVAPTFACRGNGDDGSGGRPVQPAHPRLRPDWLMTLAGLRIGITHDLPIPEYPPNFTVARAKERHFGTSPLDVIVYGDSHVEAIDVVDGTLCVNPGSPTYPHNRVVQLGTVGFLDITDGRAQASVWQLTEAGLEPFGWPEVRAR